MIGSDGKRIGKVDDLIVDRELMKVRYLDVDVDKDRVLPDTDARHILVPIGAAQLDNDGDQVFIGMDQSTLSRIPFYRGGAVDADYEYRVMHAVTSPADSYNSSSTATSSAQPTSGMGTPGADFYNREQFDEDRFYSRRSQHRAAHDHMASDTYGTGTSSFGSGTMANSGSHVHDDIATIERLRDMLDQGTITQEEFAVLKRKALGI